MFKRLSVILSLFLTACTNNIFTTSGSHTPSEKPSFSVDRTYFVGNWACEMEGDQIGSANNIKLSLDGHVSYIGTFTLPKQDPLFQYKVTQKGVWHIADHLLSYQFSEKNVERDHTYEMLRKFKTNKDLNANENEYFAMITAQIMNAKQTTLEVTNPTVQGFSIKSVGKMGRTGYCRRTAS